MSDTIFDIEPVCDLPINDDSTLFLFRSAIMFTNFGSVSIDLNIFHNAFILHVSKADLKLIKLNWILTLCSLTFLLFLLKQFLYPINLKSEDVVEFIYLKKGKPTSAFAASLQVDTAGVTNIESVERDRLVRYAQTSKKMAR